MPEIPLLLRRLPEPILDAKYTYLSSLSLSSTFLPKGLVQALVAALARGRVIRGRTQRSALPPTEATRHPGATRVAHDDDSARGVKRHTTCSADRALWLVAEAGLVELTDLAVAFGLMIESAATYGKSKGNRYAPASDLDVARKERSREMIRLRTNPELRATR